MALWIIFAGLTAMAMIAVLWPYLRSDRGKLEAAAYDTAVFKDQLEEITSENERGVISNTEAEAARTEVSRRLLAAARTNDSRAKASSGGKLSSLALACTFICVPVTSAALYLVYGSPSLQDKPLAGRLDQVSSAKKIDALMVRVEERLREHPEDGRGWEVIAPVYLRQQRYKEAADAFGKALKLLGETPQRLLDYGNALVLSNEGVVSEPARQALQKTITSGKSFVRAHFWLAVAKEQDGLYIEAAQAWRKLLKQSGENAPWREAVQQRLAAVEQRAGLARSENPAAAPIKKPGTAMVKGPSQEDVAAAQGMSSTDRSAMIAQMVAGLAERLKSDGGNIEEWKRLVRSYAVLGKKQDAVKALNDARGAFSEDPKSLASLSDLAKSLGL
jgi:cytochrome c-type biogenesis protein CcmH